MPGAGSTFTLYLPVPEEVPSEGSSRLAGALRLGSAESEEPANGALEVAELDEIPISELALPAAHVSPLPAAAHHDRLRGRNVLIVDDDPRNAFVLTDVLEMYGMTVVRVADGRQAIEELSRGGTDVVLMDMMMPLMDGHETTRAIRQMPHLARLPVIAVTARAMPGDRDKSIAAGASDYVTKPVDIENLLTCIERWLAHDDAAEPPRALGH